MEQGIGENAVFQITHQSAYRIIGTQSSLELPVLRHWDARDPQQVGWDEPLNNHYFTPDYPDPYQAQLAQFQGVIRQDVSPVVSVPDAANTLSATLTIAQSSQNGRHVTRQRYYRWHALFDTFQNAHIVGDGRATHVKDAGQFSLRYLNATRRAHKLHGR